MIDNIKQMQEYPKIREMVIAKDYVGALVKVKESSLNESTKNQLQRALELGEQYVIDRIFSELDARISQALCWECWRD